MKSAVFLLLLAACGLAAGQRALFGTQQHQRKALSALTAGESFNNPIDLGSLAKINQAGDSTSFQDVALGGCNDPEDFNNANKGDGPDVFYKWTAPFAGFLTASACSETFQAALTVLGNGTDAEGKPVVNGNLGCGGVFEGCSDPNLNEPDSQLILDVKAGQTFILHVTGSSAVETNAGVFQINLSLTKPGDSLATATFVDLNETSVVSGSTVGYDSSFNASCSAGSTEDGPDVYYSYALTSTGVLTAAACGTAGFDATVTIMAEAAVEGGSATPLACGTCANPASANVKLGQFVYIVVTGTKAGDAGAFTLTLKNSPTIGMSFSNPIVLASSASLVQDGNTLVFQDTALGGCNDPEDYKGASNGDGRDVFFKWTAPFAGFLTASACSSDFQAALTVLGNGTDAEGAPVVNGNLGCGGVFEGCSDPNLNEPDSQLILEVKAGQTLIMHVTGSSPTETNSGAFSLNLDLAKPGSSLATATYIGDKPSMAVAGNSSEYPATYASTCNVGVEDDGPDMYYSYSSPVNGMLTAKACGSAGFAATVTIMAEAAEEGGSAYPLACGTCAKPAKALVTASQFVYIVVSGTKAEEAGAFQLTLSVPPLGGSFSNPMALASVAKVVQSGDSSQYPDTMLAGCNDPILYNNATKGDGGDVFFKWTAPFAGFLTASACSSSFQAALTVLGNGTDAEGKPVVNGNLGCGGVFNGCSDPNLNEPDSQLILAVKAGQTLIMAVTGIESKDSGAFKLNLDLAKAGSSMSTATYIGNKLSMAVSGSTVGYPSTYASTCNAGKPDGPDMYYGYAAPTAGILTAKACGTAGFAATVTIMAEAAEEGGKAYPLACGTCAKPPRVSLDTDQYVFIVVSGTKATTAGAFQLTTSLVPATVIGGSLAKPINLGSPAKLVRPADSSRFLDSALAGCSDPTDFKGGKGDGGDMYFKWTAPSAGFLTATACSDVFQSSLTVIGDGIDAAGKPVKQGNLGCGGLYRSCADPNLKDPDHQIILAVKKGQALTMHVTGTQVGDYGPFKLNLDLSLFGSSLATATYIGNKPSMSVSGNTKGYPSTYASTCNARKPDGPDMYYSYSVPMNGTLTAKACGTTGFAATVTIMAEASVEGGKPTVLACGTCAKPAVVKSVVKEAFVYMVVTGTKTTAAGAFTLSVATTKPATGRRLA